MRTDVAELVYERSSTDHGIVVDDHFAGTLHGIAHDNIVVHNTIVSHVAVSHDETVVAYDGLTL